MTISNLHSICESGSFPNAYIYHICGLNWASTNDVAFAKWMNTTGVDADRDALRAKLFGDDSANVQVLHNLNGDLGNQTINYSEGKGINVGNWSVKISGENCGYSWNNHSDMEQFGIIGLDWQPVESTPGAGHAIIRSDIKPNLSSSNTCSIVWEKTKDNGFKSWLDDNWGTTSYDNDIYLYCSSGCLRPTTEVSAVGNLYGMSCQAGKLNAPNEDVLALKNRQNIFVTNYPQGIEGLTANLFAVHYHNDTLLSGTTPYLMRTGKVKNNAVQSDTGSWTLSMGGFTDQLKFKNSIGQYSGMLSGFFFNKKDRVDDGYLNYHTPFLHVVEDLVSGLNPVTIPLPTDYKQFASIDEILDYVANALTDHVDTDLTYWQEGGDIVYDDTSSTADYVYLYGLAPFVAGIGYLGSTGEIDSYVASITDPINYNYARVLDKSEPDFYNFNRFYLKQFSETEPRLPESVNKALLRVKPVDYFIQTDLSDVARYKTDLEILTEQLQYPVPEDSAGDRYLTIISKGDSDIELQAGMSIQFGDFTEVVDGSSVHGTISYITDDKIEFTSGVIKGLPMSLYSNSRFLSDLNTDTEYNNQMDLYLKQVGIPIADIRAKFAGDLFKVTDILNISVSEGADVFKAILGDPDTDIGLNAGAYKTDIKNMFDRGESNFVPMFDWDKFEALIVENQIAGTTYDYHPSDEGTDVLKMLTGLCLTNRIQMIWEYSPSTKAWWITFDRFGVGNIATATLNARMIQEQDISLNKLTAISGGGWYYNKMTAEYKSDAGSKVALNYQMTDGRIGHSLKDNTLTVDDKITLLPIESESVQKSIITRFATMLRMFCQVVYKQQLVLNMRQTATIGVGRWSSVEWAPVQNRQTGKRNDGALMGQIQSESINLSSATITVDLLSHPSNKVGIAPSLYVDTVSKSGATITCSGLSTTPSGNDFGDKTSLLTDLAYFGCIDSVSGELKDRACSCTGYRVTIFERKPVDNKLYFSPTYAPLNINVFRGTMEKLTVSSLGSSVDIVIDGGQLKFDTTKDWVVIFSDRADTGLQPCQIELYGWLGNVDNQVSDGTNLTQGITVGL